MGLDLNNVDALLASISNIMPTANTSAEYPSELPSQEDFGAAQSIYEQTKNRYKHPSNDVLNEISSVLETVYIVSERPCFRTDSLFTELSREYLTKIIYMASVKIENMETPKCFIVDVNEALITTYAKHMVEYLKNCIGGHSTPLFLIGEPEDLTKTRSVVPFPDNAYPIIEFSRPLNMKECLHKIKDILSTDTIITKRKHILVVDDSITFLKLIQRILEKDYKVTVTTSAFNCIGAMAKMSEMPDLLIIDQRMPDCDGTTLTKMLKGEDKTKDIPIIFYSGNNNVDEIIELMPMIDGYLLKSQPIIDLRTVVDEKFNKTSERKEDEDKIRV